jgi:MFS family permease
MLVAGTSGALIATVPVSAALPYIGWRGVFWVISALILLVAATLFLVLRDVEREMDIQAAAVVQAPQVHGYRLIFGDPYFRRMAVLGLVNQGIFIALQTLWAGPWMMTVLDMSRAETAQILFVFNFFLLLGYVALSWWGPRYVSQSGGPGWSFVSTVAWGLFGSLLIQLAILLCTASWSWLLWLALAGFVTVTTLVQTHVSLSFPSSLAGRANSAYNLLLFIGAFLAQWGIGVLIDLFVVNGATPQLAMRAAFAVCLALQAVALLAFVSNRAQHRLAAA